MTLNLAATIRKLMGWCPNAHALAMKRALVALPIDEEFVPGEKGKSIQNYSKMGWANIYRNFILLQTIFGAVGFGLAFLVNIYLLQAGFNYAIILKGILIGIIFSVFKIVYEWKQLNQVNQQEIGTMKKVILQSSMKKDILQTFSQLPISFSVIMLLMFLSMFTIGKDNPFQFMVSIFFPSLWISYPLVVYWERKNRKRIYLVGEKFLCWRPVALPVQAP